MGGWWFEVETPVEKVQERQTIAYIFFSFFLWVWLNLQLWHIESKLKHAGTRVSQNTMPCALSTVWTAVHREFSCTAISIHCHHVGECWLSWVSSSIKPDSGSDNNLNYIGEVFIMMFWKISETLGDNHMNGNEANIVFSVRINISSKHLVTCGWVSSIHPFCKDIWPVSV